MIILTRSTGGVADPVPMPPEGVIKPDARGDRITGCDRVQPDGPNRSTLIRSTGTPAASSTVVAASANPAEPHT